LWDIGTYRIDPIKGDDDSDSEDEKRRKRRKADHPTMESDDPYVRNITSRLTVDWGGSRKTNFGLGTIGIRELARQEAYILRFLVDER
jgi:hypothetical protein